MVGAGASRTVAFANCHSPPPLPSEYVPIPTDAKEPEIAVEVVVPVLLVVVQVP